MLEQPHIFLPLIGLLGLCVGSFLNVVIFRLPAQWFLPPENPRSAFLALLFPRSHCLHCQHPIAWYDNIPLFSFLWLKARCRACRQKIPFRYPLVEILSLLFSVCVANQFGFSVMTFWGLMLTWALLILAFIDFDHGILPDDVTLPFLWLGLIINTNGIFATPTEAILGAVCGYVSLTFVWWVFKQITGKDGMGAGDFKLLAMLGAWLGWQALPLIILFSSLFGTLIGLSLILFKNRDKNLPIPFGPFLAAAGFIAMLWGSELNQLYFKLLVL